MNTDMMVLIAIASFVAACFLLYGIVRFILNHPCLTVDFQHLRFVSAKSGDIWKVVGLNEATLCIKRNGEGWPFVVRIDSVQKALELGKFCGGTLLRLPTVNESFCLGALEWMPEGYRHYPLIPSEVPTKR